MLLTMTVNKIFNYVECFSFNLPFGSIVFFLYVRDNFKMKTKVRSDKKETFGPFYLNK